MKPETIRRIDRYLGKLLCWMFTVLYKICLFFRTNKGHAQLPVEKILFIKLIEQGATVIAYSALKRAVDLVGKDNVFFLVFHENREIMQVLDLIPEENILKIRHHNIFVFAKDIFKALNIIRGSKVDTCIDMEFFSRAPALLSVLTGAKKTGRSSCL